MLLRLVRWLVSGPGAAGHGPPGRFVAAPGGGLLALRRLGMPRHFIPSVRVLECTGHVLNFLQPGMAGWRSGNGWREYDGQA